MPTRTTAKGESIMRIVKSYKFIVSIVVTAVALALTSVTAFAQEGGNQTLSITERLRILEDKEAIRDLLERYIDFNEGRDWRGYSRLFADNGELVMSTQTLTGPDAIYTLLEGNFGAGKIGPDSPLYGASHLLSNVRISVDGDTATAVSRWTLLIPGGGTPRVFQHGKYRDSLVRVDGEWKFRRRAIVTEMPAP